MRFAPSAPAVGGILQSVVGRQSSHLIASYCILVHLRVLLLRSRSPAFPACVTQLIYLVLYYNRLLSKMQYFFDYFHKNPKKRINTRFFFLRMQERQSCAACDCALRRLSPTLHEHSDLVPLTNYVVFCRIRSSRAGN